MERLDMLYGADNRPIEETIQSENKNEGYDHIPSCNFPPPTPKPEWFDRKLLEIGGYVPGTEIPKYRAVWGMEAKHFAMGQMRMKYVTIIDTIQTTVGYNLIDLKNPNRKPRFAKPQEVHTRYMDPITKQLTRNKEDRVFIQPVVKEEEVEIGLPLWMMEYYMEPQGFGTEAAWNDTRWMINPDNPKQSIDVLGPYPYKGAYVEWFPIHGISEEDRIEYKDLDEDAIEMVRANHALNIARLKNMKYDSIEKINERREARFDKDWDTFDRELTTEILDVKKNRRYNVSPK